MQMRAGQPQVATAAFVPCRPRRGRTAIGPTVHRLLSVREDPRMLEFRSWLRSADALSEEEIRQQVESIRERVREFSQSLAGRAIRFLLLTSVGLFPGVPPVAGFALSGADLFLTDKLIGRPGPASFVSSRYPSIFSVDR